MSNEWDANIHAIHNILDRDRAEIASLKDQLIERLAEINAKDAAIEAQASVIGACRERIAELQETVKRLQANYGIPA